MEEQRELNREIKQGNGIITSIQAVNGFGFIRDESGIDLFFHSAGVCAPEFGDLREGQSVEYLTIETKKGLKAIGVVRF